MHPYRFFRFAVLLLPLLASCRSMAQQYVIYDSLPQLEERIRKAGKDVLVVNFWATWCPPCVEELPYFEELREQYAAQNVQVVLVSLDFKSQLEKKFVPFLNKQQLKSEVILFADQDANTWIPRLSETWDGGVPATIVFQGNKTIFHQGKFENTAELEAFVRPLLKGVNTSVLSSKR
jgi:thiol-disulfide isomerase/thioredoxin